VIGAALLARARGSGTERSPPGWIARLDRPPGTVRGWLRAFARRADPLARCGVCWTMTDGDDCCLVALKA